MSFTIVGTALSRAKDNQTSVELLVQGHWINGLVSAVDGYGVVLNRENDQHAVIRLENIAAVNMAATSPVAIPSQQARPMAVAG
ncbi:MAG TPA: hypothetical protein VLA97_01590 [Nocardioidaceae bacterium]|jgi:hypothetical protein|nr:hypothetical protein [Nocardioidaceae bacterium]